MSRVSVALSDPMTPRTVLLTPFERKALELRRLKDATRRHLRRQNQLRLRYRDWFQRKNRSFLASLRTVHVLGRQLLPKEIATVTDFFKVYSMGGTLTAAGKNITGLSILQEFAAFWFELHALSKDFNRDVRHPMEEFCGENCLRDPQIFADFQLHCAELDQQCHEDFPLESVHNAQDNLFTYGIDLKDELYLGLMQIVPHLTDKFARACYILDHVHVES